VKVKGMKTWNESLHIVPDLHIDEGGDPQPPVQLLVQDSDSLLDRQYDGQQALSTSVHAPQELAFTEGYAGCVAVAAG
jgi:hypothetical protein